MFAASEYLRVLAALATAGLACVAPLQTAVAANTSRGDTKIQSIQKEINALQKQLDELKQAREPATAAVTKVAATSKTAQRPRHSGKGFHWDLSSTHTKDTGITIGGALRFQYTDGSYNHDISHRKGDIAFDTFRFDISGKVHGIILNLQWRWYTYMQTLQHAWIGYDFTPKNQVQLGLVRIPFGNQPYNSHNFFFSTDYYVGLEDTMAMGGEYAYKGDKWNLQLALLKNDAATASLGQNNQGYSYVVLGIRKPGQGVNAAPKSSLGARAVNSAALRIARTFRPDKDFAIEVGGSALYGMLGYGGSGNNQYVGRYGAYALHTNIDYKRWNFQAEAVHYAYRTDDHASKMIVGAYDFYDTIPARANLFTLNGAYKLPVEWGPIQSLTFYNDNSLMTNKSGHLGNTIMIVTGVAVAAGNLYTYFDFVNAKNQPFIGGSLGGNEHGFDNRININFGYYF